MNPPVNSSVPKISSSNIQADALPVTVPIMSDSVCRGSNFACVIEENLNIARPRARERSHVAMHI